MRDNSETRPSYSVSGWTWALFFVSSIALFIAYIVSMLTANPLDTVKAFAAGITLLALCLATFGALRTLPQYREWKAEHQRDADFILWIVVADDLEDPGGQIDEISDPNKLPDEPMYSLSGESGIIRLRCFVNDWFPLRHCILSVTAPADCRIEPIPGSQARLGAPFENRDLNPDGLAVRAITVATELPPRSYASLSARISPVSAQPFRVGIGLSCSPAPESAAAGIRYALIAPRDYRGTQRAE
jgi:hypothetical protein